MRLREKDLTTVYLKQRIVSEDQKGNKIISYSEDVTKLEMNIQSAGGAVSAQIYGERLPYIKSCKYQGDLIKENKNELDGICLNVSSEQEPDYEIKSILPFSKHLNVTLERIGNNESND